MMRIFGFHQFTESDSGSLQCGCGAVVLSPEERDRWSQQPCAERTQKGMEDEGNLVRVVGWSLELHRTNVLMLRREGAMKAVTMPLKEPGLLRFIGRGDAHEAHWQVWDMNNPVSPILEHRGSSTVPFVCEGLVPNGVEPAVLGFRPGPAA